MVCPSCKSVDSTVIEESNSLRKRECKFCETVFLTSEKVLNGTAVKPNGNGYKRQVTLIDVKPFSNWLWDKNDEYGDMNALGAATGVSGTRIKHLMDREARGYPIRTIGIDTVDRMLCREGSTHLSEIYPELYEDVEA